MCLLYDHAHFCLASGSNYVKNTDCFSRKVAVELQGFFLFSVYPIERVATLLLGQGQCCIPNKLQHLIRYEYYVKVIECSRLTLRMLKYVSSIRKVTEVGKKRNKHITYVILKETNKLAVSCIYLQDWLAQRKH